MIDAIWAGIQRLWSAFVNHPDVQGFLSALTNAWNWLVPAVTGVVNAVLRFFGVSSSSNFDLVRSLIDSIGVAWKQMTAPVRLVISVVKLFMSTMKTVYNRVKSIVNSLKKLFTALPGQIRSAISSLVSILTSPFRTAYTGISKTVGSIKTTIQGITGVNIGGLTSKLTKPVTDAYTKIAKTVGNIIQKIKSIPSNIPGIGGMFGGTDLAYGGEDLVNYSREEMKVTIDQNLNLSLDLANVPSNIDENKLYDIVGEAMTSKEFIQALAQNNDFQSVDRKVKARISAKSRRARGA
jgi:hypothetical protein